MTDLSDSYKRRIAHADSIKVINNQYFSPVTLRFTAVTTESTVNIAQEHVIILTANKLLDPHATIKSQKGVVYNHLKDFACSQAYQNAFDVILDKNKHSKPHIYVKHTVESTLTINNMKYSQRNFMITILQQQVFLQFKNVPLTANSVLDGLSTSVLP